MPDEITLALTDDEALVLFEWIKRLNAEESGKFEDKSEEMILWNIEAQLEKVLVAPLDVNYEDLLKQARTRIKGHQ